MGKAKSRANGDGDVYPRKNKAGEITSYRGAYFGPDGKRRYVSGKTKTEARNALAKARSDAAGGIVYDAGTTTLNTYLDQWLEDSVKNVVRQTTYERYETLCRVHIKPALGRVKLKSLTPDHVRKLYRDKLASGFSSRTVNYLHVTIHKALGQAVSDGIIGRNVARGVKSPRPGKAEIKPLSSDQAKTLVKTAKDIDDRYQALYLVALHTGMRSGEMLALRWDDVDLNGEKGSVQVRRTLSETRIGRLYELPKSGKGRSIKLSKKATDALKSHKRRQAEERLAAGTLWKDQDLVFPTTVGTPTSATNLLGRHFKPLLKEAELPNARLHDLRHTCATVLLIAGKHPKYVQELLGHASISITLDTYSHIIEGMDGGLGDAMDEAL
ncbi:site-specific integrase [Rubrobacter indicoceani]|uniref:site-specific integrase n=1 Tax=Rubrobacter indicoceani TaxID=2051957 RepID=UPI000E5B364B|nr:site-specific integrase [Rubrobacter indicoceani]